MNLFVSLSVSLALTLVLELGLALVWGVKRGDLLLVALVNVLTNPAVVLLYTLTNLWAPTWRLPITLALEVGAILIEGWLFAKRSDIRFPWAFALCANLCSFVVGLLV